MDVKLGQKQVNRQAIKAHEGMQIVESKECFIEGVEGLTRWDSLKNEDIRKQQTDDTMVKMTECIMPEVAANGEWKIT